MPAIRIGSATPAMLSTRGISRSPASKLRLAVAAISVIKTNSAQPAIDGPKVFLDNVGGGRARLVVTGRTPDEVITAAHNLAVLQDTLTPDAQALFPPGQKPTEVTPLLQIDDGRLLNLLPVWAPDATIRQKILVTNPARLYFEGRA